MIPTTPDLNLPAAPLPDETMFDAPSPPRMHRSARHKRSPQIDMRKLVDYINEDERKPEGAPQAAPQSNELLSPTMVTRFASGNSDSGSFSFDFSDIMDSLPVPRPKPWGATERESSTEELFHKKNQQALKDLERIRRMQQQNLTRASTILSGQSFPTSPSLTLSKSLSSSEGEESWGERTDAAPARRRGSLPKILDFDMEDDDDEHLHDEDARCPEMPQPSRFSDTLSDFSSSTASTMSSMDEEEEREGSKNK